MAVAAAVARGVRGEGGWRRPRGRRRVWPELEARYRLLPQRRTPAHGGAYAVDDLAVGATHLGERSDHVRHVVCELDGSTRVALCPSLSSRTFSGGRGRASRAGPRRAITGAPEVAHDEPHGLEAMLSVVEVHELGLGVHCHLITFVVDVRNSNMFLGDLIKLLHANSELIPCGAGLEADLASKPTGRAGKLDVDLGGRHAGSWWKGKRSVLEAYMPLAVNHVIMTKACCAAQWSSGCATVRKR